MDTEPPSAGYSLLFQSLAFVTTSTDPGLIPVLIVSFILLLVCSALISGSEVAFFSLAPQDFRDLESDNRPAARRILYLRDRPRTLLATILISNNCINIALIIVMIFLMRALLPPDLLLSWADHLTALGWDWLDSSQWVLVLEFLLAVSCISLILVLFGEITPKIYANTHYTSLALRLSGMLLFLNLVFGPLSRLFVRGSLYIEQRFKPAGHANSLSRREEIDRAIDLTVHSGKDDDKERNILKSILNFGEVSVKQIMRVRVDIVAVAFDSDFQEVMDVVRESGYSRIPVYKDDLDHITGILYLKDLLGHLREPPAFEWQSLLRTNILYIPEAKKIDEVLKDFRQQKVHMAIVVDEYGGTAGLVTLEDILEEVIGDIRDEFDDDAEIIFEQLDDYNYIFDGKTMINDMCKVVGIDKTIFDKVRGDADSVAGLFLELFGQIPKKHTEIKFGQFLFKAMSVNKRRIEKIQITLPK